MQPVEEAQYIVPNYVPVRPAAILSSKDDMFYKNQQNPQQPFEKIKPNKNLSLSLAQNTKFSRIFPCNILEKKRAEILASNAVKKPLYNSSIRQRSIETELDVKASQSTSRNVLPQPNLSNRDVRKNTLKSNRVKLSQKLQKIPQYKGNALEFQSSPSKLVSTAALGSNQSTLPQINHHEKKRSSNRVPNFLHDYMAGKMSTKPQEYKHKSKQPAPKALQRYDIHPTKDQQHLKILSSSAVEHTPTNDIWFAHHNSDQQDMMNFTSAVQQQEENKKLTTSEILKQIIQKKFPKNKLKKSKQAELTNRVFDQKIKHQQRLSMISIDEQLLGQSMDDNQRAYLSKSMHPKQVETAAGIYSIPEFQSQGGGGGGGTYKRKQLPPELTLKNIIKRNPNIKERIRLSSLAEVAERHLLEKNLDKLLGGSNVLSGLNQLELQQLLYLAPHIQNFDGSTTKQNQTQKQNDNDEQAKKFAYFSAPPLERADARFKKIVSLSNKIKQDSLDTALRAIDSSTNFQQPPMCFAVNQIPGLAQQKKQLRKNKPGSSPMRLRNIIKQSGSKRQTLLNDLMTFKRKLNSPLNHSPKKKLRKFMQSPENRSNSKKFAMSGRISSRDHYDDNNQDNNNNGGGGQSIYKVQIQKDEIAEAIEQLMDRGDEPKMDIEKARRGNTKQSVALSPEDEAFAGLTGEDKQKQQFDQDLARLLNEYRPKVTLWKSTLGDKLFLLDNVDKVKGHSFEELQKQLKQITKAHH